eukprot:GHVP01026239.1.p1 GENE.GHVP01026239.1~~GHVP01026239.1.p1  ORF type:complete len:415 (+),score=98.09 GHVP01026239.1:75-1247(+)
MTQNLDEISFASRRCRSFSKSPSRSSRSSLSKSDRKHHTHGFSFVAITILGFCVVLAAFQMRKVKQQWVPLFFDEEPQGVENRRRRSSSKKKKNLRKEVQQQLAPFFDEDPQRDQGNHIELNDSKENTENRSNPWESNDKENITEKQEHPIALNGSDNSTTDQGNHIELNDSKDTTENQSNPLESNDSEDKTESHLLNGSNNSSRFLSQEETGTQETDSPETDPKESSQETEKDLKFPTMDVEGALSVEEGLAKQNDKNNHAATPGSFQRTPISETNKEFTSLLQLRPTGRDEFHNSRCSSPSSSDEKLKDNLQEIFELRPNSAENALNLSDDDIKVKLKDFTDVFELRSSSAENALNLSADDIKLKKKLKTENEIKIELKTPSEKANLS